MEAKSWSRIHSVTSKKDTETPATKADLHEMLSTIMTAFGDAEGRMENMEGRMENMEGRMSELETKMDGLGVQFEELRHDALGMLKDVQSKDRQVDDHEHRIQKLEVRFS